MEIHKDIALLTSQPNGEGFMKKMMPLKGIAVFQPRSKLFLELIKSNPWGKGVYKSYTCLYTLTYILNPKHTTITTFIAIILLSMYETCSMIVSLCKKQIEGKDIHGGSNEPVLWLPTISYSTK